VGTGSHEENASKQESRDLVLIESGPKLWSSQLNDQYERTLRHRLPWNFGALLGVPGI